MFRFRRLHPVLADVCSCDGDKMGILTWLKTWVLDAKVSRDDVSNAFNYILSTIDDNGDDYISIRELIKAIKLFFKKG